MEPFMSLICNSEKRVSVSENTGDCEGDFWVQQGILVPHLTAASFGYGGELNPIL